MAVLEKEIDSVAESFQTGGFLHLKKLFEPYEVEHYVNEFQRVSGLDDEDADHIMRGEKAPYVEPGGISKNSNLWPLLTHPRLLPIVHDILGCDIRFIGSDNIIVHQAFAGFHPDTFIRSPRNGPPWDPDMSTYGVVRAITYLHGSQLNYFQVIPGSHRAPRVKHKRNGIEIADGLDYPITITIDEGDLVLFDARLHHAGVPIAGPKYAAIWAYAIPNRHSVVHYHYSRIIRTDQKFENFSDELIDTLKEHDLYWGELDGWKVHYEEEWKDAPKGKVIWAPYGGLREPQ